MYCAHPRGRGDNFLEISACFGYKKTGSLQRECFQIEDKKPFYLREETGMAKAKKGDMYSCEVCGLIVVVDEVCGCATADLVCCKAPMARGKAAAAKAKKKALAQPAAKAPARKAKAKVKPAKKAAPRAAVKRAAAKKPAAKAKKRA
jgi:hypothetical protein